jgi:hypothetical protein
MGSKEYAHAGQTKSVSLLSQSRSGRYRVRTKVIIIFKLPDEAIFILIFKVLNCIFISIFLINWRV